MAQQIFTFDERSMRLIAEMVKRELKRPQSQVTRNTQRPTAYKYTRLFELTEELTAGGTATAALVRWDEDTEDWVASEESSDAFTVYDFIGSMTGEVGTRGIAQNLFGKWVIIQLACAE